MRSLTLLILLATLSFGPAKAQWRTQALISTAAPTSSLPPFADAAVNVADPPASRSRWSRMVLPSTFGSLVGVPVGAMTGSVIYEMTGCCFEGGDDPGLSEVALGAILGSTFGSALGAYVIGAEDGPVSFRRALLGSALGFFPAAYLGAYAGEATNAFLGFSIFGLTHAGITASFAASTPRRVAR